MSAYGLLPHPFWHELWGWRKRRCVWCAFIRTFPKEQS